MSRRGALWAYAPVDVEQFRQAAGAVNKILRGMKPADLPVEEPTRYELVINLKTAKSLGIEVSPLRNRLTSAHNDRAPVFRRARLGCDANLGRIEFSELDD